ncbi:hypothetical protein DXN05_17995 [Deminuibacter soli]|uniref:Uncharacterized protein n=1 Tax=Deminuibacter soli TaxID=2291815 RepID=A0A3E1NFZ2_9BACT|nr:hypothetical protein DXN05_17995 [Deminuibacter soli]
MLLLPKQYAKLGAATGHSSGIIVKVVFMMVANRKIKCRFRLYAALRLLHGQDEPLSHQKLHALWHVARIDDVESLLQVCKAGTLIVRGFGAKTQQNVVAAIKALHKSQAFYYHVGLKAPPQTHPLNSLVQTFII